MQEPLERIVVTAGRHAQAWLDTSTPITLIDSEEILNNGSAIISDYLRGQAGVFVQQTTPGQGLPIVRGLKGSEVLHLVDGFRLNNAIFRNAPNQYLALVDAANVQSIEVVRGSASSLYGSDAMGGVVQVLTKAPETRAGGWWREARVLGRYASADNTWMGHGEISGGVGDFGFQAGITGLDAGNRRVGSGETIRPSDYTSHAGNFSLLWAPGEHELLFNVQYLKQPNTPRVDELIPGFDQDEPDSDVFNFEPNSRFFAHTRYRYNSAWALADQIELHAGFQSITDDRRQRDFGGVEENRERNESELWGFTGQFNKILGGHLLTYGFEYYHDEVSSSRIRTNLNTGVTKVQTPRFPDGSEIDSFAVYLHDEWQLLDWLRMDWGLRYSDYHIDITASGDAPAGEVTPDDLTGDGALIFTLNDQTNLIAGVGRGFRAPNIFDLGTLGERPGNRFNIPASELGPETIYTYQLGLRRSDRNFQGEIFVFYSDFKDKINNVLTNAVTLTGRDITQSANINSAELYGIEAAWNWAVTDSLTWHASVNWTRATEKNDNGFSEPGDRVAPVNGRSGLVWRPSGQWRFEPYLLFAGRQDRLSARDIRDPRINPDGTPGWVTFNLRAAWMPRPNLDVRLRVENLFDKSFREHASGIDAPGINVIAELDMRFP